MVAPAILGRDGGRVIRTIVDGSETLRPGHELSAECVLSWPLRNRKALESTGRVMFYNSAPVAAEVPAPRRGRPPGAKTGEQPVDALFK